MSVYERKWTVVVSLMVAVAGGVTLVEFGATVKRAANVAAETVPVVNSLLLVLLVIVAAILIEVDAIQRKVKRLELQGEGD